MREAGAFVEHELGKQSWGEVMDCSRPAVHVPDAIRELICAETAEQATEAYWKIDNRVIVQGTVYPASIPVVRVLLAALATEELSPPARRELLELLFQILNGYTNPEEATPKTAAIVMECRKIASEGMWLFYRDAGRIDYEDSNEVIGCILDRIDSDKVRVSLASHEGGKCS